MEGLDDLIKKTNLKLDRHAKNQLIGKLFGKVIERNEYRDKWMADNAWVQAIYETTNISTTFEITACELNSVISRNSPFRHNSIEHLLSPNRLGLYKRTVHLKNSLSKTLKVTAYYSTKPGCLPPKPKRNNKWHQEVLETPPKAKGTLKQLQTICERNNLPIEKIEQKIVEGWSGKPKGMLQVLWERGFIDPDKKESDYTVCGKKDDFQNLIPTQVCENLPSLFRILSMKRHYYNIMVK